MLGTAVSDWEEDRRPALWGVVPVGPVAIQDHGAVGGGCDEEAVGDVVDLAAEATALIQGAEQEP